MAPILKLPTLEGQAARDVVVAIELLRRAHEHNAEVLAALERQATATAASLPTIDEISAALSSGGVAPVVVTNSLGGLPPSPADRSLFLSGTKPPRYEDVRDQDLTLADLIVNNATTGAHGFLPKLSGQAGDVLNGLGEWISGAAGGTGGFYAPVTNGDPISPEILFDTHGEVIMGWEPHSGI